MEKDKRRGRCQSELSQIGLPADGYSQRVAKCPMLDLKRTGYSQKEAKCPRLQSNNQIGRYMSDAFEGTWEVIAYHGK
jgi:hypothetical protein